MPSALIRSRRFIGAVIPDCVLEEVEVSPAHITTHPCELGSEISDHMILAPKQVTMRVAWSDCTHQTDGFIFLVYKTLVALQALRQPFNVSTGKKLYRNMVFESLVVTTDETSEFILSCICGLKEVIITSTSGGGGSQADAAQTGPMLNGGLIQPQNQGAGNNSADQFRQFGGLSNNTSPSLGSIPGIGFGGIQ